MKYLPSTTNRFNLKLAKLLKNLLPNYNVKSEQGFIKDESGEYYEHENWFEDVYLSDRYAARILDGAIPAPKYDNFLYWLREEKNIHILLYPTGESHTQWYYDLSHIILLDGPALQYCSEDDARGWVGYYNCLEKAIEHVVRFLHDEENKHGNPFEKLIEWLTPFGILKSSTLEDQVVELLGLDSLGLSYYQLTTIPKEIGELKNLKALYLNNNQLTTIPKEIGELDNLKEIYLENNNLTSIPIEIGELDNLEELYLENNNLTSIPKEIGELKNLKTLLLDDNQLTSIPQEIGELKNLKRLFLYDNQLTSIPKEIRDSLPNCEIAL